MIITKKRFEEAMTKVRAEEQTKYEKREEEREKNRWQYERIENLERRMNNAFEDIDRRLTELEKRAPGVVAACLKY